MGLEEGTVAVDLCCGGGSFTTPLALLVQCSAYGIDLDPNILERARAEVERIGGRSCRLVRGDARELTRLGPGRVDYVFLANTFHGVESKTGLAREAVAALCPNGRFGVVNWHWRRRDETVNFGKSRGPRTDLRMTLEDTRIAVEPAGFELERIVDLPPSHYGADFLETAGKSK